MTIRQEIREDHDQVYEVIKSAFASAEHSDGNEQDLAVKLRASGAFVPELSLVAVENGEINLRDADLRNADLRGANLRDADLCDAIQRPRATPPLASFS